MNSQSEDTQNQITFEIIKFVVGAMAEEDEEVNVAAAQRRRGLVSAFFRYITVYISAVPRFMFTALEEEVFASSPVHMTRVKNHGFWKVTHRRLSDRVRGKYSFRRHYRVTLRVFDAIVDAVEDNRAFQLTGNNRYPTEIQVAVALWRFANCHFGYRMMEATLGISDGSIANLTERFLKATMEELGHKIHWPSTDREVRNAQRRFEYPSLDLDDYTVRRLSNVIGCVDGKLVEIHRPKHHSESFRDRKGHLSVNLTAVCDSDCRFLYVYAGQSGRLRDCRVFDRSELPFMSSNSEVYFPRNAYLLGDSAYNPSQHMVITYSQSESAADPDKRRFNAVLSSMRQDIERPFGLLVKRWRFLFKYLYILKHQRIVKIITCCCILHNLCIDMGGKFWPEIDDFA